MECTHQGLGGVQRANNISNGMGFIARAVTIGPG